MRASTGTPWQIAPTGRPSAQNAATAPHAYTASLASGALGLIGGVSLALRKPFTFGVAKQDTPRELWDHPGFIRVNMVISAAWTVSFMAGRAALAALRDAAAV